MGLARAWPAPWGSRASARQSKEQLARSALPARGPRRAEAGPALGRARRGAYPGSVVVNTASPAELETAMHTTAMSPPALIFARGPDAGRLKISDTRPREDLQKALQAAGHQGLTPAE